MDISDVIYDGRNFGLNWRRHLWVLQVSRVHCLGKGGEATFRALCVFVIEGMLFTTPVNYQFAWRGTWYLNNRVLYGLRQTQFTRPLHRFVLSEIHYAIRGIAPSAISSPEKMVTYLTSVVMQTVELLREFADLELSVIPDTAEQVVEEYLTFVEDAYELTAPDVDVASVVEAVIAQFSGEINLPSVPAGPPPSYQ